MDDETRAAISAAKIVSKGLTRTLRTYLHVVNELEKRLEALDAEPQLGGRANGDNRSTSKELVGRQ
jgi:hypothetical protein